MFVGALYHVIVRGNERKAVFRDDRDRKDYLRRLAHYGEKFECGVLAYRLMDNHVHLAIETGKTPLSRIMAGLQSSYTHFPASQEESNCNVVLEARAGVQTNGPDSLRFKLGSLLSDPERLARMRSAARAVGRPRAAEKILSRVFA